MPRLMYDSVTAADIPSTAQMVAGYVDGAYKWSDADWQRFRNATLVRITVTGTTLDADVADVEAGDLTAYQAAEWVKAKIARGDHPTLYFSASRLVEIENSMVGVVPDPYHGWSIWVADWNGQNAAYSYGVAHQYANPTLSGGHYDLSWVADYWPGVDPAPAPTPAPLVLGLVSPSAPPPVLITNLDQARASWAKLGELLLNDFPGAVERVAAAIAKINNLP